MSTIGNYTLHLGLEGVNLCETNLSHIDGEKGELTIRGYPLSEIAANGTYEEMMYLLWTGKLPNTTELDEVKRTLNENRELPDITLALLRRAASNNVYPMDALRMAVSSLTAELGNLEDAGDKQKWFELGYYVVAKVPTILAGYSHLLTGNEPIAPDNTLGHVANFLFMLSGEQPNPAKTRALETYLNTVSDHGMNASTFVTRTIVSTDSDLISAVAGGIGTLKGPKHGGAPGPVLEMIFEIGDKTNTREYIKNKMANGERIMGFGHRVYKVRDPRAEVLANAAEKLYEGENREFYNNVLEMEEIIVNTIEEIKPGRRIKTNVEFYTSLVLHGVGLAPDLYSSMFAMGRVSGWIANIIEQYENNRLIRPRAIYVGEFDKTWVPVDQR